VLTVDTDTGERVCDVVTVVDQSAVDVLVIGDMDRAVVTTEATDAESGTFVTTVTRDVGTGVLRTGQTLIDVRTGTELV
jgi:hypothetical protein